MSVTPRILSPLWTLFGATLLSFAWLIPNHFLPWTAFHADAAAAIVLTLLSAAVLLRSNNGAPWHGVTCAALLLLPIPWLQYAGGMIPFLGDAWVCTAYVLGFLLALLVAAQWEGSAPLELPTLLFTAIGLAAVVSVGLEIYQWAGLTENDSARDIWIMYLVGGRMYANMGQPNLLATLLVWGLLASAWAYLRGSLGGTGAIAVAVWLIFGIALTQSRTALVEVAALAYAAWHWRSLWPSMRFGKAVLGVALLLILVALFLEPLSHSLLLDTQSTGLARTKGDERPAIWDLFIDASTDHPWLGYGWNQVRVAQIDVILRHPEVSGMPLSHAHNLFLDLLLWNGWPVGFAIIGVILWWVWSRGRRVRTAQDAVLFMAVIAVGIHSMLELPLHYAFFLLPTGLFVGALNARLFPQPLFRTGRILVAAMWLAAAAFLAVLVHDYANVESTFTQMRMEKARLADPARGKAADVVFLTQLRDLIQYVRSVPHRGLSESELQRVRDLTAAYPSTDNLIKAAIYMGINHRQDESELWLRRAAIMMPAAQQPMGQIIWRNSLREFPELAAIAWPN